MGYKINVNFADGVGTRPFELIDSNGDIVIDEIRTKGGINPVPAFGGKSFAYISGGLDYPNAYKNEIERFPFATTFDETDVGDISVGRYDLAGQSSSTHGYNTGGWSGGRHITIDKFQFVATTDATDIANLTQSRSGVTGQSSSTHGYTSGGFSGPPFDTENVIDKFPFSSDTNATDVGNLVAVRALTAGMNSTTHGYTAGGDGTGSGTISNVIDKFSFSNDGNATDVGDLTVARSEATGHSSATHGYAAAGSSDPSTISNVIDKFPFATDANATDVGDTNNITRRGGVSSIEDGYIAGGQAASATSPVDYNSVYKFPFAVDENTGSQIQTLPTRRNKPAGTQI